MRIDRSMQISLGILLAAALSAGCSGGGSGMTPASQSNGVTAPSQRGLEPLVTYSQMAESYPLKATGESITFPQDGDATGGALVPDVTTSPLPTLNICENDEPIVASSDGCLTAGSASDADCSEAANTFWYLTLNLTNGPEENHFSKSKIPVSFKSPNLIPKNSTEKYGLCVIALGFLLQDDFAEGKAVSQKDSKVMLTLVIPKTLKGSFPTGNTASIFIEHN